MLKMSTNQTTQLHTTMQLIKKYKLNRGNLNPTVSLFGISEDESGNKFIVEYEPRFGSSSIAHERFETMDEATDFIGDLEEKDEEEAE